MKAVTRAEWTWVAVVAVAIILFSTLPYLAGYLAQTDQQRFGHALLDRVDYHSYLARMGQGYRGEWRFQLLFSLPVQQGVYFQPFYIVLGHIARLSRLTLPLVYQLARVGFALPMLLAVYRLIAQFVRAPHTRRVAFLLAVTASGLGWLTEIVAPTPPGGISPMDFWLLDGFVYLVVLTSPHFCAAIGLLLAIFILLLRRLDGPSLVEGGLAVLLSLLLGLIHPYTLLLADLLPLLYWGLEVLRARRLAWRKLATVVVMGLAQLPLVVYELWTFRNDPVFAGWSAQNVTLSPPPRVYLAGYALLLLLAVVGVGHQVRRKGEWTLFALLWIGLVAVLAYLPWNLQRRFLEGVTVPLGLLAGVGLAEGLWPLGGRAAGRRWLAQALLIALAALSNLYLTVGLTVAAAARAPAIFDSADLLAGVDWLGAHAHWDEPVLSAFESGNLIAGRIAQRVVLGHWMETVDYAHKADAVARCFDGATSDEERQALLDEWRVRYLFYGPHERALGDWDPRTAPYLEPVFERGEVVVYQVTGSGP